MKNKLWQKFFLKGVLYFSLVFIEFAFTATALTAKVVEFPLQPVEKDRPFGLLETKEEIGQKCDLRMTRVHGNPKIEKPPLIDANVLYYAEVVLGNPEKTYGILIDLEGAKKLIWVDADADRDFAEEASYEIFKSDRYPGLNVYFCPMPLRFNVEYLLSGEKYTIPVSFDLPFLVVARAGYHDFLLLKTRTWLASNLYIAEEEIPVALVDADFNGCFNDPQDMMFLDTNYDLNFSSSESVEIKKASRLRIKRGVKVKIDFVGVPQKIIITYN